MFTRILVPTDFSECADAALETARRMAAKFGGSLYLLHVMEDPMRVAARSLEGYVPDMTETGEALQTAAMQHLEARISARDRIAFRATAEAVFGTPAVAIIDYAARHGIDLIIMGTHGRTGVKHMLVGSVAERVVRTAPCAVLTVRQRDAHAAHAA